MIKCLNHSVNRLVCTYPDGWHLPIDPASAPFIRRSVMFLRGNINIGGINVSPALMEQITVTRAPLSAAVSKPTCNYEIDNCYKKSSYSRNKGILKPLTAG